MKKILFTLLLVAGGFVAQAQNNITLTTFTHNGGTYALGFGNSVDDTCIDTALSPDQTPFIYTYNASSGILSRDGQDILQYTGSQVAQVAGLFDGNFYSLYAVNEGFTLLARNADVATYQE